MDLPELPALLELLQKHGVSRFSAAGVSVEFDQSASSAQRLEKLFLAEEQRPPETDEQRKARLEQQRREDEALQFASAEGGGN